MDLVPPIAWTSVRWGLHCAGPLLSQLGQQTAQVSNSHYYKIGKFTVEMK